MNNATRICAELFKLSQKLLIFALIISLMPTMTFAKGASNNWDDLKQLPLGLFIIVKPKDRSREKLKGALTDVTDDAITITVDGKRTVTYPKSNVKEIHEITGKKQGNKSAYIGLAIGAGIGLAGAGVSAANSDNDEYDGLVFIALGTLGALTGYAIGGTFDLFRGMQNKTKKIYVAKK